MTKKTLKIGFVLDDSLDKPDGVQQYVLALAGWLNEQGYNVHYLVGKTARQDVDNIHSLGKNVNVRFNHNRMSIPLPTSRRKIRELLAREDFDVLHVQMPFSPWLAGRLISAAGVRTAVVGTFHIVPYSWQVSLASRVLAVWSRRTTGRFDKILSVSSAAAQFAKSVFKVDSEISPNVIDYERFAAAKPLPQYRGKLTILFLGRLVPRKGCLQLLKAIKILADDISELPAFEVVICGKGPLMSALKAFTAENHLESCVEFAGFVSEDDKPRYLASADIAVFPSSGGESFGIVLAEAMISGNAAVLGGNNIGYRAVLSGREELLFNPKSPEELAEKIRYFLLDGKARRAAAAWGQDRAKEFDVAAVGQDIIGIYNRALHKRRNMR